MRSHYNKSKYMARWPQYLPFPYSIRRSRGQVPNASSVDWPQAQFAPLYLPAGSPSFQPYVYRTKPSRYPPGAKVFSIFPGKYTLPFSVKLMGEKQRRKWMRRPDGDIIAVPQHRRRARPNAAPGTGSSTAATEWQSGDLLNLSADIAWGGALSPSCQGLYLERVAVAKAAWDDVYRETKANIASGHRGPVMAAQWMRDAARRVYVAGVLSAQSKAVACEKAIVEATEDAEYEELREHKVETQETASEQMETAAEQAYFQSQLESGGVALESAKKRQQMITYAMLGVGGIVLLAVGVGMFRRR